MTNHQVKPSTVAITNKTIRVLVIATFLLTNYAFVQSQTTPQSSLEAGWSANLLTPGNVDQLREALTNETRGPFPQALRITPTVAQKAFESNTGLWEAIQEMRPTNVDLTAILGDRRMPQWRTNDGLDLYATYDANKKLEMILVRPPGSDPSQFTIDLITEVAQQGKTFRPLTTDSSTKLQNRFARQQTSQERIVNEGTKNPFIDTKKKKINLDKLQKGLQGLRKSRDLYFATNVTIGASDVEDLLSGQEASWIAVNRQLPTNIDLAKLSDGKTPTPELLVGGLDAYALYDEQGQFRELAFRPRDLDEAQFLNFIPSSWNPVPVVLSWGNRVISTTKQVISAARNRTIDWACTLKPAPIQITITVEAAFTAGAVGLGGTAGATYDYADLCTSP